MDRYSAVVKARPADESITAGDVAEIFSRLSAKGAFPLSVAGGSLAAFGFVSPAAAELMGYDFSGLAEFVLGILDKDGEGAAGDTYEYPFGHGALTILIYR